MDNQPVQNPTSEPTLPPVQVPEPKTRFPVIPVLLVILLLLLGSTAFLYYQNMQLKKMLANYQTPVVSPTPSATADPTANWKTYTDTKFEFSFKYPSDYEVTLLNGAINLQKNNTRALLYLSKSSNPDSLEIPQWFESQPKEDIQPIKDTNIMTETIVDGRKALKFTKIQPEIGYKDFSIIVGNKTNVYSLNFGPLESEVGISNQILSTFKFTQ